MLRVLGALFLVGVLAAQGLSAPTVCERLEDALVEVARSQTNGKVQRALESLARSNEPAEKKAEAWVAFVRELQKVAPDFSQFRLRAVDRSWVFTSTIRHAVVIAPNGDVFFTKDAPPLTMGTVPPYNLMENISQKVKAESTP